MTIFKILILSLITILSLNNLYSGCCFSTQISSNEQIKSKTENSDGTINIECKDGTRIISSQNNQSIIRINTDGSQIIWDTITPCGRKIYPDGRVERFSN